MINSSTLYQIPLIYSSHAGLCWLLGLHFPLSHIARHRLNTFVVWIHALLFAPKTPPATEEAASTAPPAPSPENLLTRHRLPSPRQMQPEKIHCSDSNL